MTSKSWPQPGDVGYVATAYLSPGIAFVQRVHCTAISGTWRDWECDAGRGMNPFRTNGTTQMGPHGWQVWRCPMGAAAAIVASRLCGRYPSEIDAKAMLGMMQSLIEDAQYYLANPHGEPEAPRTGKRICPECGNNDHDGHREGCGTRWGRRGWRTLGNLDT